ncbi:MAG TPA: hypothetical protein VGL81_28120 [Polyangiaceae bacterium]|jgi:hypothetical protein
MRPRTLALGTWLATRGAMAGVGFALAIAGALASVVAAVALSGSSVAAELPLLESSAIAWTAGVVLAFGAAVHALRRDREQGIVALVRARGGRLNGYVRGRVGGLVLVLAVAVGGATLVAGVAATSAAHPPLPALHTSVAAVAYALAFAVTLGPVAMATLGARTRSGGLLTLLAVLALPELVSPWTSALLPRGWHELTSIPAALAAVRAGVAAPAAMAGSMARGLAGLAAVVALSLVVIAARVRRAEGRGAP